MGSHGLFECFAVVGIEEVGAGGGDGEVEKRAVLKWSFPPEKKDIPGMNGGVEGIAQFAFPKLRMEKKRQFLAPFTYVFGLTLENGQFMYGYCRKLLPPSEFNRYDHGERYPEVLCMISTSFEIDLYLRILDCLATRRIIDPPSVNGMLQTLMALTPMPEPSQSFRVKSTSLGVLCEYKFMRPAIGEGAHVNLVFKFLTPKTLRYLVGAIMCEQRVICISSSEVTLSLVIHGLLGLMYPFIWQHMFVPLMPEHLLDYLAAPSPYLVGILSCFEEKLETLPLGEVVVVNLDKNELKSSSTIHPFGAVSLEKTGFGRTKPEDNFRISNLFSSEVSSLYKGPNKHVDERSLKILWLSFTLFVFGNVTNYGSLKTQQINKESFVASCYDPDLKAFLSVFVHTQMFNNFVERQFDYLAKQLNRTTPSSDRAGQTGVFRQDEKVLEQQNLQDSRFRSVLARVSEFTYPEVKKVVKNHIPPRRCTPGSQNLTEALEIIPNTIKTGSNYDPNKDEHFERMARRSYDTVLAIACNKAIWKRVSQTTSERSWRYGYNAMLLLRYLLSAGSEVIFASAMKHLPSVVSLLRLSMSGKGDSLKMLRRITISVYQILMDKKRIIWERSPRDGHKLFLASREKAEHKQFAYLRCRTNPFPKFKDIHTASFNPQVDVKPTPPVQRMRPAPRRPVREKGSQPPPPPPPPPPPSTQQHPIPASAPANVSSAQLERKLRPPPPPASSQPPKSHHGAPPAPPPPPPPPPRSIDESQDSGGGPPPPPPRAIDDQVEASSSPPPPPPPRAFEQQAASSSTSSNKSGTVAPKRPPPRKGEKEQPATEVSSKSQHPVPPPPPSFATTKGRHLSHPPPPAATKHHPPPPPPAPASTSASAADTDPISADDTITNRARSSASVERPPPPLPPVKTSTEETASSPSSSPASSDANDGIPTSVASVKEMFEKQCAVSSDKEPTSAKSDPGKSSRGENGSSIQNLISKELKHVQKSQENEPTSAKSESGISDKKQNRKEIDQDVSSVSAVKAMFEKNEGHDGNLANEKSSNEKPAQSGTISAAKAMFDKTGKTESTEKLSAEIFNKEEPKEKEEKDSVPSVSAARAMFDKTKKPETNKKLSAEIDNKEEPKEKDSVPSVSAARAMFDKTKKPETNKKLSAEIDNKEEPKEKDSVPSVSAARAMFDKTKKPETNKKLSAEIDNKEEPKEKDSVPSVSAARAMFDKPVEKEIMKKKKKKDEPKEKDSGPGVSAAKAMFEKKEVTKPKPKDEGATKLSAVQAARLKFEH